MKKVLFISERPLGRCENITAVFEAFKGEKIFDKMHNRTSDILHDPNAEYDLVVTDELVKESRAPVMMIYHGAAGGKTYLRQRPGSDHLKPCSDLVKYVITSSKEMTGIAALQCGVPESFVYPLGIPRMDELIGKKKGDGKTHLTLYKRAYLYAPTYRHLNDETIPPIDLWLIDKLLTDDEIFVVKPHMVIKNFEMGQYGHIMYVPSAIPSAPYIMDCDVLITDYSSIMFDAHAMRKPVVLFAKDKDAYLNDPGMCLNYPDGYSSRFCEDEKTLVEILRKTDKPGVEDYICREKTTGMCDGYATERVVDLINDILEGKR